MTINKKIKNTRRLTFEGVRYKSMLEVSCVKLLKEAGLKFEYENQKFTLIESFTPALHFYKSSRNGLKKQCRKDGSCIMMKATSYTPDFWFKNGKVIIFIETKGYQNDVYSYKRKLFFRTVTAYASQKNAEEIYFFEPSNIKEIKESILIIKNILLCTEKQN